VALLTCAAFYVIAINSAFYIWGDNAHYIIVAKSVAMGQGLRDLHTPGNPPFSFPVPLPLYVFLLFSLFHNVHLATRLRTIDAQITRLVRDTAIAAAIRPDTSTMPSDARNSQV
jgi:hypothetical protein